jgi:hypothetical protein
MGVVDHAFEEDASKTSKTHSLFAWYPNNTYLSVLESS